MRIEKRPELGRWFVFKEAARIPRHRWFYYKEGFSPALVRWFIERTKTKELFDPFMGVGTVPLEACLQGLWAGGIEAFNFAFFVAKTKLQNWDDIKWTEPKPFEWHPPFFSKEAILGPYLKEVERLRRQCGNDLCILMLTAALSEAMGIKRDGAVLKRRPVKNFFKILRQKEKIFRMDLKVKVPQHYEIFYGDARRFNVKSHAILTSPPYLNGVDYRKIYGIEAAFALGKADGMALPSYGKNYREQIDAYLNSLWQVFQNWEAEYIGIVIGNLATPQGEVEIDKRIAQWFEDRGYKTIIYRGRRIRANFSFAISHFHESLIFVEK